MSPFGPLLHVMCGKLGFPVLGPAALGVSEHLSLPEQPSSSPQIWRRFSQWPTSCVAVRPRLNGAFAVPVFPNAVLRITTPSVLLGPPGNCAYPSRLPASRHTQMFR